MASRALLITITTCFISGGSCAPRSGDGDGNRDFATPDYDNDSISDADEGKFDGIDSDGDTRADYVDVDTDNDTILDIIEAGDADLETPPVDSDGDGIADFRDQDSDNNGRADAQDGPLDVDNDGIPNFADPDDDNDGLSDVEEMGSPQFPLDSDRDGQFDYQDIDSDNDGILDLHEGLADPDGDGIPAYRDDDSDGDCRPDFAESGDNDISTPPSDTDNDRRPDYLDRDADNDGLTDGAEDANCNGRIDIGETLPDAEDSDGDSVSDLIEVAAGSDPLDANDTPQSRGDFVFIMPYEQPPIPTQDTLEFKTSIQVADVYFSFDTTGSMAAELNAMRAASGVPAIINELQCADLGLPCVSDGDCAAADGICFDARCVANPLNNNGCIPSVFSGVGQFEELDSFENLVSLQANPNITANAVPFTGGGVHESVFQPPACVADGNNCANSSSINCDDTGVGCVGYRDNAIRILVQVSDADNQCIGMRCSEFDAITAGQALIDKNIKFIGLFGDDDNASDRPDTPADDARAIGIAGNSTTADGLPFVYEAINSQVVPQTVAAIQELASVVPLSVDIVQEELPGDDGDGLRFIDHVAVNVSGIGNCTLVTDVDDNNNDGYGDAFPDLTPGTPVCWDVVPIARNLIEPASEQPKVYKARLQVRGDGSPLDARTVFFLVPPQIVEPAIE